MKIGNRAILMCAALILTISVLWLPAQAQQEEELIVGKKGAVSFNSNTWFGNVLLKPGDYQIEHAVDREGHVVVFKRIVRSKDGHFEVGKEAARAKCKIEPIEEKDEYSWIRFGFNEKGEKAVKEIHLNGENAKHVF